MDTDSDDEVDQAEYLDRLREALRGQKALMDALNGESPVEDLRRWLANPPRSFDEEDHGRVFMTALSGPKTGCPNFPLAVRKELIEMLLSHGITPVADGETPLFVCATAEEAAMLLDGGVPIDARERHPAGLGDTALLHQVKKAMTSQFNLIRFLVSRGADLDARGVEGATSEEFCRQGEHILKQAVSIPPNLVAMADELARTADFLEGVRVAGSYKAYARAPRIELARLRLLCARGRASPPPVLARLFAAELPNGVFWSVLSFWRSSRETFDDEYADSDALAAALEDASLV